jgi:hypothetical protein
MDSSGMPSLPVRVVGEAGLSRAIGRDPFGMNWNGSVPV